MRIFCDRSDALSLFGYSVDTCVTQVKIHYISLPLFFYVCGKLVNSYEQVRPQTSFLYAIELMVHRESVAAVERNFYQWNWWVLLVECGVNVLTSGLALVLALMLTVHGNHRTCYLPGLIYAYHFIYTWVAWIGFLLNNWVLPKNSPTFPKLLSLSLLAWAAQNGTFIWINDNVMIYKLVSI